MMPSESVFDATLIDSLIFWLSVQGIRYVVPAQVEALVIGLELPLNAVDGLVSIPSNTAVTL